MEREHRGRLLAAIVGISLLGCGGGGEPVTDKNVGRKFAEIFCAGIRRCCQTQGMTFTTGHFDACVIDESFLPLQRAAGVSNPVFNPDGANECLKAAARYDCTNRSMVYESCDLVYAGGVALGSPCGGTRDCAQAPNAHAVCSASGGGGTCVPATLFQPIGATCIRDDLECDLAEGLWCNAGTCAPRSPIGSPCAAGVGPGWQCAKGAYCGGLVPQMCTATTPVGTTCVNGLSCTQPADCTNGVCTAPGDGFCLF